VGVRVVDPATGRPLSGAAATRGVLVRVSCARGCKLTRVFRLRPGRLMVRSLGGRRVAVRVTRRPGRLTVDLARLFTDRSGDRHAFSPRAEIQVRLTKAGYRPTGFKLRADISGELRNCAVRGTRLVGCRLES
jgi:hypothetical protein